MFRSVEMFFGGLGGIGGAGALCSVVYFEILMLHFTQSVVSSCENPHFGHIIRFRLPDVFGPGTDSISDKIPDFLRMF